MVRNVAEKLGYKPGMTVRVLDRPEGLADALALPEDAPGTDGCDLVLAFVNRASAVTSNLKEALPHYRRGGCLWIAYPKKSGKIATDISRDHGWGPLDEEGLLPVTQIAIDDDWSALRFRHWDEIPKLTRKSETGR